MLNLVDTPPETQRIQAEGFADYVKIDLLIGALEELRAVKLERLKITLAQFFIEEAAENNDYPTTFKAMEAEALGTVQLRRKPAKALSAETVALLRQHHIPLKPVAEQVGINPTMANDPTICAALGRLLANSPDSGVPAGFIVAQPAQVLPADGAILRALRLQGRAATDVLAVLANIIVLKPELTDKNSLRDYARQLETLILGSDHNNPPPG